MRPRKPRPKRRSHKPGPRPTRQTESEASVTLIATYEIGGKRFHRVVSDLPDDDEEGLVGISASFDGGATTPEFLAMIDAWEASDGEETVEAKAATEAYARARAQRPCPCGSGHTYEACCGA